MHEDYMMVTATVYIRVFEGNPGCFGRPWTWLKSADRNHSKYTWQNLHCTTKVTMNTISSISIVLAIVTVASGYPTGPPARSCASMAPSTSPYGHGAQAQTSPPPYVVTMDVPCNGYAAEKTYKSKA